MAYSQARNKATQKYVKANYERIYISIPKGNKDIWKTAADAAGESLTSFIVKAVEMRLGIDQDPDLPSDAQS